MVSQWLAILVLKIMVLKDVKMTFFIKISVLKITALRWFKEDHDKLTSICLYSQLAWRWGHYRTPFFEEAWLYCSVGKSPRWKGSGVCRGWWPIFTWLKSLHIFLRARPFILYTTYCTVGKIKWDRQQYLHILIIYFEKNDFWINIDFWFRDKKMPLL